MHHVIVSQMNVNDGHNPPRSLILFGAKFKVGDRKNFYYL